mmetsp:Transcript_19114/g.53280  ORF Transcript_19114/g.53280 Transcript_19114/m.53280 type:complete len:526 (+) Transcript_19114:205-1782(+)
MGKRNGKRVVDKDIKTEPKPKRRRDAQGTRIGAGQAQQDKTEDAKPSRDVYSTLKLIAAIIAPMSCNEFFTTVWEQKPLVFHNKFTENFFCGKFSFGSLLSIASDSPSSHTEKKPLAFGVDINAARYRDGVRETPNNEAPVRRATLEEMYRDGITFQLHQPQRFDDDLMVLMADLEAELGCLVGCNAYLTPKGSQGLAPHHDDVEIFVCQTHGKKRWWLYQPLGGFQLPSHSSGDLPESIIGAPVMDVTLKEGDVLYMPRGTVHQAAAQKKDSAHLTISTYQRWSWGDLAVSILQQAINATGEPGCLPISARLSLPPGFLYQHGLAPLSRDSASAAGDSAARLATCLREMADRIETYPQMLAIAADSMAMDMQRSRLAPNPEDLPAAGEEPAHGCMIAPRCAKGTFRVVPDQGSDGLMLLHCLSNDRMQHMMPVLDSEDEEEEPSKEEELGEEDHSGSGEGSDSSGEGPKDLNLIGPFPDSWLDAAVQVLGADNPFPLEELEIDDDDEQLEAARFLWRSGALMTL